MSDVKLVKVDNWGIYFLQRLKHFFNRTDYCDLTLQFQDNAQLKVHRLVLSGCTEYFEVLERTCEMYDDCLVMPDDLQADVVVPIVNFMYTGQLEFRMDLLERLYQTAQVMNLQILTKLLDAHRHQQSSQKTISSYSNNKKYYAKRTEERSRSLLVESPTTNEHKRSHTEAFGPLDSVTPSVKKVLRDTRLSPDASPVIAKQSPRVLPFAEMKIKLAEPRPTRYELPEGLESALFEDSFSNISYASEPLVLHPETLKHYPSKKNNAVIGASSSMKSFESPFFSVPEYKNVLKTDNVFEEPSENFNTEEEMLASSPISNETPKVTNQLFDQILEKQQCPKVTIEAQDADQAKKIDHAKIISEVLKKYPHLVKSNKSIKLKILDSSNPTPTKTKKQRTSVSQPSSEAVKVKSEPDYTFETDVLDSQQAARLIALGAENIKGPWICLICGTPGRALHFTSYYKFRRHLVEIHNEKAVANMCEYCGFKCYKRNSLLYHALTKHGVAPPPNVYFPKCNHCSYIALTEALLNRHKLNHVQPKKFRCNVCCASFAKSNQLLSHIRTTGHKYSADKKPSLQCIYCQRVFLRENNLFSHLKTIHKHLAINDGIIDDSDEESEMKELEQNEFIKLEKTQSETGVKTEEEDEAEAGTQYQIRADGSLQLVSKKSSGVTYKQKILNTGFESPVLKPAEKNKDLSKSPVIQQQYEQKLNVNLNEEIIMIDNSEYVVKDNQFVPQQNNLHTDEFIITDIMHSENNKMSSTSDVINSIPEELSYQTLSAQQIMMRKQTRSEQPIEIVVSNEEEYKALMNSNHSIIFDNGDSSKTLTVLSAPQNTPLNHTNIDLDNTQTNNSMIVIPENYPITVSEGLPTNDSNIVVVYSHELNTQEKPYQLIATKNIEAQFLQSSPEMTSAYETVTTSSGTNLIDSETVVTWQNNIENVHNNIHMSASSEQITIAETSETTTVTSTNSDLLELPNVSIESEKTVDSVQSNLNKSNTVNNDGLETSSEQMVIEEATPADVDVQDNTSEEIENEQNNTATNDVIPETETSEESDNQVLEHMAEDTPHSGELGTLNESKDIQENVQIKILNSENHVEDGNDTMETPKNESIIEDVITSTKPNIEQVKKLASEWSEDEYDVEEPGPSTAIKSLTPQQKDFNLRSQVEAEESIENIQKEVNKQMTEITEKAVNFAEEPVLQQNDGSKNISTDTVVAETIVETGAAKEKISSLLNDWEDNEETQGKNHPQEESDPQEESNPTKENDKGGLGEGKLSASVECKKKNENVIQKDEKLKSLVSDWDDEEEEVTET